MTTFLTKSQVCRKVGYSKQHIARLVDERRFPPPVKPFGKMGRSLWVDGEIEDWMQAKIRERNSSK